MSKLELAQQVLQLIAELDLSLHEVLLADRYAGVVDILSDTPEDDDPDFRKDLTIDAFNEFARDVDHATLEALYSKIFD